jgi:hypothetical protein
LYEYIHRHPRVNTLEIKKAKKSQFRVQPPAQSGRGVSRIAGFSAVFPAPNVIVSAQMPRRGVNRRYNKGFVVRR